jgi:hypothetical protein
MSRATSALEFPDEEDGEYLLGGVTSSATKKKSMGSLHELTSLLSDSGEDTFGFPITIKKAGESESREAIAQETEERLVKKTSFTLPSRGLLAGLSSSAAAALESSDEEDYRPTESRQGKEQLPPRQRQQVPPRRRTPELYSAPAVAQAIPPPSVPSPPKRTSISAVESPVESMQPPSGDPAGLMVPALKARIAALEEENRAASAEIRRLRLEVEKRDDQASAAIDSKCRAEGEAERLRKKLIELESTSSLNARQLELQQAAHEHMLKDRDALHAEAIAAANLAHRKELENIRHAEGGMVVLEGLAQQVQSSASALKQLQAQMHGQQHGAEMLRQSHLDARERLVVDLESSVKSAKEMAEEETQRLRGVLTSMDAVMSMMRGQHVDERERLHQEHTRLEALHASMKSEMDAMRKGIDEERLRLSARWAAFDEERREMLSELHKRQQAINEQAAKLERERAAFANLQNSAAQAAEEESLRQKRTEAGLEAARRQLEAEMATFEMNVSEAQQDLRSADTLRSEIAESKKEAEEEHRRLRTKAADFNASVEEVNRKSADAEEKLARAEALHSEGRALARAARESTSSIEERKQHVENLARQQEAERIAIAKAKADALQDRGEARRLRMEAKEISEHWLKTAHRTSSLSEGHHSPGDILRRSSFMMTSRSLPAPSSDRPSYPLPPPSHVSPQSAFSSRQTPARRGSLSHFMPHTGMAAVSMHLRFDGTGAAAGNPSMNIDLGPLLKSVEESQKYIYEQETFLAANAVIDDVPFTSDLDNEAAEMLAASYLSYE